MTDPRSEAPDAQPSDRQESGTRDWDGPTTRIEAATERAKKVRRTSTPTDRQTR